MLARDTTKLRVSVTLFVALVPGGVLAKQDCNGALVYLGQTANQSRSVWLSATGAGSFALEATGQVTVDQWSKQRRGLRVSLSPDVSNGNGNPHSLFETSGTPCLIDKQNQKGGITFPPHLQLPPNLPPILRPPNGVTPSFPIATLPPGGITAGGPGAVTPPIGTLPPPSGVTPGVPGGVTPPIGTLPPSGVTPGVPGGVAPPMATLPPAGMTPTVPGAVTPPIGTVPPPSGVTPGVPGGVSPPIGTLPPTGITPGVPGGVTPPVGARCTGHEQGPRAWSDPSVICDCASCYWRLCEVRKSR